MDAKNNKGQARLRLVISDGSDGLQRDLYSSSSFSAESPPGAELRPCSMSQMVDLVRPMAAPISARLSPDARNCLILEAQSVIGPSVRDVVDQGQRPERSIVSAFRFNLGMDSKELDQLDTLGKRLRFWRKKRGFSAPVLAERAGIRKTTLYGLENGGQLSSGSLGLLAEILRIRSKYLTTGQGTAEVGTPEPSQEWPWTFDKRRLNGLTEIEFELLNLTVLHKLEQLETKKRGKKVS